MFFPIFGTSNFCWIQMLKVDHWTICTLQCMLQTYCTAPMSLLGDLLMWWESIPNVVNTPKARPEAYQSTVSHSKEEVQKQYSTVQYQVPRKPVLCTVPYLYTGRRETWSSDFERLGGPHSETTRFNPCGNCCLQKKQKEPTVNLGGGSKWCGVPVAVHLWTDVQP